MINNGHMQAHFQMEYLTSMWNYMTSPTVEAWQAVDKDTTGAPVIKVYPNTQYPTKSWNQLKANQTVNKVQPLPLDTPIYPDKLRWEFLSR